MRLVIIVLLFQISYGVRMTRIDCVDWLAIASSFLTQQEKLALEKHRHKDTKRLRFLSKDSTVDYFKVRFVFVFSPHY